MKRSKSYKINGKLDEIIGVFTDLNRFGDAHPLIYKVEQLDAVEELLFHLSVTNTNSGYKL